MSIDFPKFPHFEPITSNDRDLFSQVTSQFDNYSDFNFYSFWSWNTEGLHYYSVLNGNLVITMGDYVTGDRLLSILGNNHIEDSIKTVLEYAKAKNISSTLKLVPEVVVQKINTPDTFKITEDEDSHDYLFSISELATLSGNKYKSKRHAVQACEKYGEIIIHHDCSGTEMKADVLSLLESWKQEKLERGLEAETDFELSAISRMLDAVDTDPSLLLTCAMRNGTMVGFSIDERMTKQQVMSHYFKTLHHTRGTAEFLNREVARALLSDGYTIWNWEQDLGLPALRTMKQGYRPTGNLKKYTISLEA